MCAEETKNWLNDTEEEARAKLSHVVEFLKDMEFAV
jgi:hypothetical protein